MNIEKTISEQAVSDILTPMLESQDRIVTEDVAPLFDQATGLDTPTASGTVTTTIEESRSVITAIIRKAWTATLTMLGGASVIGYITAAYTYLRTRLQGNETYGIPDRRSEISATSPLAANLALLNDRKIGGVPEAADGMSMANLIGSAARNDITEITDPTKGWNYTKSNLVGTLKSLFPSLDKVTLGMGKITNGATICTGTTGISELNVPELEEVSGQYYMTGLVENIEIDRFHAPKVTKFRSTALTNSTETGWFKNLPDLEEIILGDEADGVDFDFSLAGNVHNCFACKCSNLKKVVINSKRFCMALNWGMPLFYQCPIEELDLGDLEYQYGHNMGSTSKLLKLSIKSANCNLDFAGWTPDSETLAHQDFLPNFKTYIAKKLTDNGSGKTLTLSQAVFSEIWDSQGQPQVKGDGLDQLRADIHRIIRTDKQWAVNKA